MNLKIIQIIEKLNPDLISEKSLKKPEQEISAVKFYIRGNVKFKDNIVYIAKDEYLYENSGIVPQNIIIICSDKKLSRKIQAENMVCLINIDKDTLLNEISDFILDSQFFVQSSAALFNKIIQGRGLSYIMDIAGELLGNPIMLGDANHRLLAVSKFGYIDDEPWMEFRNAGYCSYEYTQKYAFKKWIEESVKAAKPIIGELDGENKYRRIFSTVVIGDRIVGHVAVLEYNRKFNEKDLELTSFICNIIASEMKKNKYYGNTRNLMLDRLMIDLLQENYSSKELVKNRINNLKWKIPEKKYVLAVRFNSYEETYELITYLREALKEKMYEKEAVVYETNLVLLIGCAEKEELNREDFDEFIEFLKNNKLKAGISQSFSKLLEMKKHYIQAVSAMELGEKIGKVESLFMYKNYTVHDLLQKIASHEDILEFCHPAVLKLKRYDEEHNTEYLKTLYTYLTSMGNIVAASEALYIHRNTMSYRLTKIQSIISMDFNDNDINMNLFFSYKILEYTGKL